MLERKSPSDSLREGLNLFRLNGSYCDATIRVEGKQFQCHRAVLASVCDYFNSLFSSNFKEGSSQMNDITLHGIDATSFNILLECIYLGRKPNFNEDNIYGLLQSSDYLQLQSVKNLCVEYIWKQLPSFSSKSVFEIFNLACGMNDYLLMSASSRYCVIHMENSMQEDFFLQLTYNSLNLVFQQYCLPSNHFGNQKLLLYAVIWWVLYNFNERQKFIHKLIKTIGFSRISKDCIESLLKEYKIKHGAQLIFDENAIEALSTFIMDKLSLDRFVEDNNTSPISHQDLQLEITSSIFVYGRWHDHDDKSEGACSVFSLNKHSNNKVDTTFNEISLGTNWFVSCNFTENRKYILTSSCKSNHIYCLFGLNRIFRAYNSVDLTSDQYIELAPPVQKHSIFHTETCEAVDGNIYFCDKYQSRINCYNSSVDRWFSIVDLEKNIFQYSFVTYNNLLYLIEGKDFNHGNFRGKILYEQVQVYDCRIPRLLELSPPEIENDPFLFHVECPEEYYSASCVVNEKIYVYNGRDFRVFDPVAGKWLDIEVEKCEPYNFQSWPGQQGKKLKMISNEKQLFVFSSPFSTKYLTYNFTTRTLEESKLVTDWYSSCTIEDVITFKST